MTTTTATPPGHAEYLNLREVAELLRLKERKLYDLVREGRIPCVKVTGKWLFPRARIDAWIAEAESGAVPIQATTRAARPGIIAGSRDPLLDWAIAQSGCGLATLGGGSLAGLEIFKDGGAVAAGLHLLDRDTGEYNTPFLARHGGAEGAVLIEWARREQGLVVAPNNPAGLGSVGDVLAKRARIVLRQPEAGAHVLLDALVAREGRTVADLKTAGDVAQTGLDVGLAVLDGRADCGLAVRAVARRLHLDFVPLAWERFDLLMDRREYFEPTFQQLLAFCRSPAFRDKAADLQGYDLSGHGTIRFNGP